MALADMHTSEHPDGPDMVPYARTLGAPICHCDIAIDALERASKAIACADIEARCNAVATATEAMTSLFLEFDGIEQDFSAQGAGRLYESILGRLLDINLHNNLEIAREAITMIEQLRNGCTRWSAADSPPSMTAAHRAEP